MESDVPHLSITAQDFPLSLENIFKGLSLILL